MNRNLLCIATLMSLVSLATNTSFSNLFAADGYMVTVTAATAPIKIENKVLGTVTRGTRLWVFEEKGAWLRVKVPNEEKRGWITASQTERVRLTAEQGPQEKKLFSHWKRGLALIDAKKYAEAIQELESCLALERLLLGQYHPAFAVILEKLGLTASAKGDDSAAREYFAESLAIQRKVLGSEHTDTAFTLHFLGILARDQRNFPAARKYFEEALAIRRKLLTNVNGSTALTLYELGITAYHQNDILAARQYLDEALAIRRKLLGNEHPDIASALHYLGLVAHDQDDFSASRSYYEEALAIRRKGLGNEHIETARTLSRLGYLAHSQDDYQAARKFYDEALAIRRKAVGNENESTAETLSCLGSLAKDQGDYPAAQKCYDEALLIFCRVSGREHLSTARTLNSLGILARVKGDYPGARKYYDEALAIQRRLAGDEHLDTAQTLNCLGNLFSTQGNYPAARKCFEESLAITRKISGNGHTNTISSLNNLGSVALDQGDYPSAQKCFDESLAISRKVLGDENPNTAAALHNLGMLALLRHDMPAAQKYCQEALAIRRMVLGNDHLITADSLNSLGFIARDQGEVFVARNYIEQALTIKRKLLGNEHVDTASMLVSLGNLASKQRDYSSARKYYDEALIINRKVLGTGHPHITSTLRNLALLSMREDNPLTAAPNLEEERRNMRLHAVRTLPALSEEEQLLYLQNIYHSGWLQSLSFGRSQRANAQHAEQSADWLVNGKGLTEESLALGAQLMNPETIALIAQLRTIRGKLAETVRKPQSDEWERRTTELKAEEQRLVRSLAQARGEDLTSDPWVEIAAIRRAIPAQGTLVNMVRFSPVDFKTMKWGAPLYVAWLIPSTNDGDIKIIDLGDAEAIDAAVAVFRKAMAEAGSTSTAKKGEKELQAAVQKSLDSLADLVWKPLAKQLADKEELILSPDAALWLVPWGALPETDGKFLIEKYSLKYVISGRELVTKKANKPANKSVVLADPDFDLGPSATAPAETTKLARRSLTRLDRALRLPGTAKEAEAISPSLKTYSKSDPVVYLNREATESRFKQLVSPHVLVLGTHGFYFPQQEVEAKDDDRQLIGRDERHAVRTKDGQTLENPLLRCGVLLAGCNRAATSETAGLDDGVLTGLEIVNADLRGTELVVLSACETGLGDVRNGEGVAGLRQAFQLAGAKAVVSTLWQIPDDESAQLMSDFFGYLAEGKSKAEALRFAQLNRIAERRERDGAAHPFYWAAYTLTE